MTTADAALARRLTTRLDTLWDFDYEPTHQELESLYETAKKNQWNAATAIDWTRPLGQEGPVLNVGMAFQGARFFDRLTDEEKKEVTIRVFNRLLFTGVLIPRLQRLGLLSSRVEPRYREIGLLEE
jgi:hypothetical protein